MLRTALAHSSWTACLIAMAASAAWGQTLDPLSPDVLPRLQVAEVLRLDAYDDRDAFVFSSIPAAAVLSDDEIALVDRMTNEIRVFGLDGTHVRTFASEGDGPGEFRYLTELRPLHNDRLMAWGFERKRLSVFEADGSHVRTLSIQIAPGAFLWTDFVGAFEDGSFVLRSDPSVMAMRHEPDGYRRDPTHFIHHTADGEVGDTLCTVQGPGRRLYHEGSRWGLEERLFEREVVGATVEDVLLCGTTEEVDLRRVSVAGVELSKIALTRPRRGVSTAEIGSERVRLTAEEEARQERLRRALPEGFGPGFADASRELERIAVRESYATRPAFQSVMVGSDGDLWVQDYPSPEARGTQWVLFDGDRPIGWLEVGRGETVLAFGHGLMVKRLEDDLGVQTAVVMRVGR